MNKATSGFAVASLILGIFAAGIGWIPFLGWLFDVLAVLFAILAMVRIRKKKLGGRGLAIAGLTLGIIGTLLAGVAMAGFISYGQGLDDAEETNLTVDAPDEKKKLISSGDYDIFEDNNLTDTPEEKKKLVTSGEYDIFDEPNSLLVEEEEEEAEPVNKYAPYPEWGSWTGGITWRFPPECLVQGDNFGSTYWYAKYDPEGVRLYDFTMSGYGARVEGPKGPMLEGVLYKWDYPVGAYTYNIEATRTGLKIKGTVYQERDQWCKDRYDPERTAVYDELWGDLEGEIVS